MRRWDWEICDEWEITWPRIKKIKHFFYAYLTIFIIAIDHSPMTKMVIKQLIFSVTIHIYKMYRSQNNKLIFLLLSFIDSHFLTFQENNNPCFIPVVIKLSTNNNDQTFGTLKLNDDRWKNFIYDYEENEGENNHYKNNLLCKWIITTENSNQRIL